MKKIISIIFVVIVFLNIFVVNVSATDIDINSVWDEIDNQTKDYLNDLGIDEISFNDLFDLSPTRVIEFLIDISFKSGVKVFQNIFVIIAILFIVSVASAFLKESDKVHNIICFVGVLTVLSVVIVPISRMITDVVTGIKTSYLLILTYLL